MVMVAQSSLRVVLDEAKKLLRQKIQSYFVESPDAAGHRYILMNELSASLYSPIQDGETLDAHSCRLLTGMAMQLEHGLGHDVTVLCVSQADSQLQACKDLGINTATMSEFFNSDKVDELGMSEAETDTLHTAIEVALRSFEGGKDDSSSPTPTAFSAPAVSA